MSWFTVASEIARLREMVISMDENDSLFKLFNLIKAESEAARALQREYGVSSVRAAAKRRGRKGTMGVGNDSTPVGAEIRNQFGYPIVNFDED